MTDVTQMVGRLRDRAARKGEWAHTSPSEWTDALIREAAALIESQARELETLRVRIKELDPDPVVCNCREAGCPHTPIAKLPRQALVDHYKERLKLAEQDCESRLETLRRRVPEGYVVVPMELTYEMRLAMEEASGLGVTNQPPWDFVWQAVLDATPQVEVEVAAAPEVTP